MFTPSSASTTSSRFLLFLRVLLQNSKKSRALHYSSWSYLLQCVIMWGFISFHQKVEFISSPLDSRLCDLLWPTEFSRNDGVPVLDYRPKALHALLTLLEPWNYHEHMPGWGCWRAGDTFYSHPVVPSQQPTNSRSIPAWLTYSWLQIQKRAKMKPKLPNWFSLSYKLNKWLLMKATKFCTDLLCISYKF